MVPMQIKSPKYAAQSYEKCETMVGLFLRLYDGNLKKKYWCFTECVEQ